MSAPTHPRALPADDAAAYVTSKIYELAPTYQAVATLQAPVAEMRQRLGDTPADLAPIDDNSCLLRSHTDTVEWLAFRLTMLGCEFEVHEPPELVDHLRHMGVRINRATRTRPQRRDSAHSNRPPPKDAGPGQGTDRAS